MLRAISSSVLFGTSSLNKYIKVAIYDEDDHDDDDYGDDDSDDDGDDYDDDINDDGDDDDDDDGDDNGDSGDDDGDGDYRTMLIVVEVMMVQRWWQYGT